MARGKGKGPRKALKGVSTPVTMRKRGAIRELSLAGVANCIIDKVLQNEDDLPAKPSFLASL